MTGAVPGMKAGWPLFITSQIIMGMNMKPGKMRDGRARFLNTLIMVLSAILFWLVFRNWDCLKEHVIRLFR